MTNTNTNDRIGANDAVKDVESGEISKEGMEEMTPDEDGEAREVNSVGSSETERTLTSFTLRNRKIIFASLILIVGACASAAFLAIGILNAKASQADEFDKLTDEFVVKLQGAFNDYELFGRWIHESCRERGREGNLLGICNRQEFHELYEYILSAGPDFQSAQFMPYVPHIRERRWKRKPGIFIKKTIRM
jgi:hypothetical protein